MKTLEQLAREAGATAYAWFDETGQNVKLTKLEFTPEQIARFRAAVRAEALEEAAHICNAIAAGHAAATRRSDARVATHAAGQRDGANECAAAILEMK